MTKVKDLKIKVLLPIGTVVRLKKTTKNVMIIGSLMATDADKKIHDYVACFWPEGVFDTKKCFFFNHEDIENIIYNGPNDRDEFIVEGLK